MAVIDMDELPTEVFEYIVKLRKEAAQFRSQRNSARAEADQLRAELSAGR
ncbi:hypothetical protein DAVIS_00392 [Mycobacterium marinum]|uniref:Uncharacterized protein n=1 Tax=Mycobacterium marinum TaxID=1781 RepID=A0A3E2N2Q7_MYCMR|nr:hypothetical protein [Mycobacterium marinum]RFZ47677.1 hypothetical protein DAVIS_00392 [Mycobacterium marinum]